MNLVKARGVATCLLFLLSLSTASARAQVERFVEGVHYTRLPEAAASLTGNGETERTSLQEVFWYGCGSCYAFDPLLNAWLANKGATLSFTRTPMVWNDMTKEHARLYYASAMLGLHERMHSRIFDEIHQKRNLLVDEVAVSALFGEYGVDQASFDKTWSSFALDAQVRKTETRLRELRLPSVPALIVNGTFLVNNDKVATQQMMLDVAEFLLDKK